MPAEPDIEPRIRASCEAGCWDDATTLALQTYGPELMSYLVAILRNASDADDVFGVVSEELWGGLRTFRWESSLRTFAYVIARNAAFKQLRDPGRRRKVEPLSCSSAEAVVAQVRSQTVTYLRTETKDKIANLRAALDPEDQTLLILRVNRQLAWRDIAQILAEDDAVDDASLDREASALRKRFERLKAELRAKAAG